MEIQPREPDFKKNYAIPGDLPDSKINGFISVYETHAEAEAAVRKLHQAGFDMKKLSIVGRDYQSEESIVGYYNIGDRMKYWGKLGAFWGGLWGLLFGSAMFIVPGFGPLVVAGTFASALVGAVEGAAVVGGLSAVGVALFNIGVPRDSVLQYETDLKAGKYVMIAHGSADDVKNARETVKRLGATGISDFEPMDNDDHKKEMNS